MIGRRSALERTNWRAVAASVAERVRGIAICVAGSCASRVWPPVFTFTAPTSLGMRLRDTHEHEPPAEAEMMPPQHVRQARLHDEDDAATASLKTAASPASVRRHR